MNKKSPAKKSNGSAPLVKQRLPRGLTERKIRAIIEHYDNLTDDERAAEIDKGFANIANRQISNSDGSRA